MFKKGIKEILSEMTLSQKLDYLWTYYKWVLAVVAAVVMVICIVVSCVRNKQTETLYSGILINVEASDEGKVYLSNQWCDVLGGDSEKQKVELMTTSFQDISATSSMELEAGSVVQVTALVAAQKLDYVIMEDIGFNRYQNHTIFAPLEKMLPAEQLRQLNGHLKYHEDGENGRYPIAIDISDSAFVSNCITGGEHVYIAFPGNTDRTALNSRFLDYLLNWQ